MSAFDQPAGYEHALAAARANMSPRFVAIDRLERYWDGSIYDGRPNWFTGTRVAQWDRKPCIKYPLVAQAVDSNVDLVFGEGRFPTVTTNPDEDDTAFGEESGEPGLGEQDSSYVDRFVREVYRVVNFGKVCREAYEGAQVRKSVALVVSVRDQLLHCETVKAQWCTPTFGTRMIGTSREVLSLEIRYPYLETRPDGRGGWTVKCKLYRRVIDGYSDVTFLPADARDDSVEPAWTANTAMTFYHGFGFCPVQWYAHRKEQSSVEEFDGRAIHERVTEQVEALDLSLSARHSAALMLGAPQPYETGVDPGYNPAGEVVASPMLPGSKEGGQFGIGPDGEADRQLTAFVDSNTVAQGARPKGPAHVWQYESPDAKVALLEMSPMALEPISAHARDVRVKLSEGLGVVFIDAEHVKFAASLSGKALKALRERQINRCDRDREDLEDGLILPTTSMLLRICVQFDVKVRGVKKARTILGRFLQRAPVLDSFGAAIPGWSTTTWDAPLLGVKWPQYFTPEPEEEAETIQAVTQAMQAGLCSRRQAVEKLRRMLPIENVDQAVANSDGDPGKIADVMAKAALGGLVESDTYRREMTKRYVRSVLAGVDPKILEKIEQEIDAAEVQPLAVTGLPGSDPDAAVEQATAVAKAKAGAQIGSRSATRRSGGALDSDAAGDLTRRSHGK